MSFAVATLKYGTVITGSHLTQKQVEKFFPNHSVITTLFSSSLVGVVYQASRPRGSFFPHQAYPFALHLRSAGQSAFFFSTYKFVAQLGNQENREFTPGMHMATGFSSGLAAGLALTTIRYPLLRISGPISSYKSFAPFVREITSFHAWQGFKSSYHVPCAAAGLAGAAFECARYLLSSAKQN